MVARGRIPADRFVIVKVRFLIGDETILNLIAKLWEQGTGAVVYRPK
jgi:hypothetical protein